MDYYGSLINGIEPSLTRGGMSQYKLSGDYHAANNNCVTKALSGAQIGLTPEVYRVINNDSFDKGRGLTWSQRTAYRMAKEGSGIRMPLDLMAALTSQAGANIKSYSGGSKCE